MLPSWEVSSKSDHLEETQTGWTRPGMLFLIPTWLSNECLDDAINLDAK